MRFRYRDWLIWESTGLHFIMLWYIWYFYTSAWMSPHIIESFDDSVYLYDISSCHASEKGEG